MSQETIISNTEISFKDFLFKNKRNRTILWLAAAAIVIQFAVFKYFYPFASFIHGDSFSYIKAATENLNINTYLIGYSKFLRLFSILTKADYVLVFFQYFFIQTSALFLLFTIFYFCSISNGIQIILICFSIFNPLFLHLGNLISSDGFFLALSLTWFSLLLWIINKPLNKIIIWHAIVLFIAFTTRYNALIYPIIAGIAFGLSNLKSQKKILGIGVCLLPCLLFIGFTMYQYKNLTNHLQYSPFSGWQFANNAMYAYRYVNHTDRKPVPEKFKALDNMIRQYYDSTRNTKKFPVESVMASTYYMWSGGMPLMKYRDSLFNKDTTASELKKWASVGPLYKDYGIFIIKQYPFYFLRYFIWPNANKYYAPPIEFLDSYNSGRDSVTKQTKEWFGYETRKVVTRMKDKSIIVLNYYPILSGIINGAMLFMLICYFYFKGWKQNQSLKKIIISGTAIWLLNAGFTIMASSAALRFQAFPIHLSSIIAILLIEWLWHVAMNITLESTSRNKEEYHPELVIK